jgi:hypothetical protein
VRAPATAKSSKLEPRFAITKVTRPTGTVFVDTVQRPPPTVTFTVDVDARVPPTTATRAASIPAVTRPTAGFCAYLCKSRVRVFYGCSEVVSTTSKSPPVMRPMVCSASFDQRGSGAPLMYQFDPLSARIIPYVFSA